VIPRLGDGSVTKRGLWIVALVRRKAREAHARRALTVRRTNARPFQGARDVQSGSTRSSDFVAWETRMTAVRVG
jgi:hypothetical protein